jgi:hypothetical protein
MYMRKSLLNLLVIVGLFIGAATTSYADDPMCKNPALYEVFAIIDRACNEQTCDEGILKEINTAIERGKLLAAMDQLKVYHIFFPVGKSDIHDALDFDITKKDQLASLKYSITNPEDVAIYVLGRGSASKGSERVNWELARKRTLAVYNYLTTDLALTCRYVQKVAFGKTVLQLSASDAGMLRIPANDFRNDTDVLNQSVEVFIYPCRNSLHKSKH